MAYGDDYFTTTVEAAARWEANRAGYDSADDLDARWEAAADAADERAVTCEDCGTRWDPGVHPATRWEPAYAEVEECPNCGGGPERSL